MNLFFIYYFYFICSFFFLFAQSPQGKERKTEPKRKKTRLRLFLSIYDLIKIPHSLNSGKNGYKAIAFALPFFPSDKQSNVLWNFD